VLRIDADGCLLTEGDYDPQEDRQFFEAHVMEYAWTSPISLGLLAWVVLGPDEWSLVGLGNIINRWSDEMGRMSLDEAARWLHQNHVGFRRGPAIADVVKKSKET